MRYIDVTYDGDARTLTLSSSLAGTTVDDLSSSFRIDEATARKDADIDIVYGVILRSKDRSSAGYSFSRFAGREAAIPQEVLKACRGGSLPVYLRITYRADGTIETSMPLTLKVANLPDPVESAHATGDLIMLRQTSWTWRAGITYAAGAVVVFNGQLWMSAEDGNQGNVPGSTARKWNGLTTVNAGAYQYIENLTEDAQQAIDGLRADQTETNTHLAIETAARASKDAQHDERLDSTEAAVRTVQEDLDGKQNQIAVGTRPDAPRDGDIWLAPGDTIIPVAYQHASVADVQNATTDYIAKIATEKAEREAADATIRSDTVTAIGEALQAAKAYADQAGASAYRYKGSISNAALDILTGAQVGDLYNISDNGRYPQGSNVVWTGSNWDKLSETLDLSPFTAHIADRNNPHGVDYTQIGLSGPQLAAINSGVTEALPPAVENITNRLDNLVCVGRNPTPGCLIWFKPKEETI